MLEILSSKCNEKADFYQRAVERLGVEGPLTPNLGEHPEQLQLCPFSELSAGSSSPCTPKGAPADLGLRHFTQTPGTLKRFGAKPGREVQAVLTNLHLLSSSPHVALSVTSSAQEV